MEPQWFMVLSWVALGLGFASALAILADQFLLGNRQHMGIMNLVHPITALYWGPVWLWAYVRNGRKSGQRVMHREARRLARENVDAEELRREGESTESRDIRAWHIANAVSHCGAGCTLGDIAGEWILFAIFASPTLGILGTYGWEIIVNFILAWTLGIVFQYLTIVPMRDDVGRMEGIRQAIKVDTASIVAFQLGLFGWMALSHFVLFQPGLTTDTPGHWFMMQVGMIAGFFTAWPVNRRLVLSGVKEKMDHRKHLATMVEQLQRADAEEDEPLTRDRRTSATRARSHVSH